MKSRIATKVLGGLLVLAAALPCSAGPREDASAAVDRWAAAFNSGDVDKILATYTPDALVLGTTSPGLASTPDELRAYFGASAVAKPQVKLGERAAAVLSNDAVVMTGFYEFSGARGVFPARFTFIIVSRDYEWRIAHHHSSIRPKPPAQ